MDSNRDIRKSSPWVLTSPGDDWTEGESGTVSISGGSIDVVAEKVTANAAFLVGTSSNVNATLNSFATDWETQSFQLYKPISFWFNAR